MAVIILLEKLNKTCFKDPWVQTEMGRKYAFHFQPASDWDTTSLPKKNPVTFFCLAIESEK